ncbi:unnamed protein product, partial [Rotaria sordida]
GTTIITSTPVIDRTNFTDNTSMSNVYTIKVVLNGAEHGYLESTKVLAKQYLSIPLQIPSDGTTSDGVAYKYNANDYSVGNLDRDGKAEVACKTADGTRDGINVVIGDPYSDYRNSRDYILTGSEYLTVFNGEPRRVMATVDFVPARSTVASWSDNYGNHVNCFVAAVAYVDDRRSSLIMDRGYYTRHLIAHHQHLEKSKYASQGNRQMSIGDVDEDEKDEICNGASAIDDDGRGLYAKGKGYGDALHMTDIDPDRPGQEVWQCYESTGLYGQTGLALHDGKTG